MAEEARPQYRVTGALIYMTTGTVYGPRKMGLHRNAIVPADVPQEQIDHHLSVGLIEPVDAEPVKTARKGG